MGVMQDVLGRFNGRWDLHPVRDPASGKVVGCKGLLEQDVLPKGERPVVYHCTACLPACLPVLL